MIQVTEVTRAGWCIVGVRGRLDAESAEQLETVLHTAIWNHDKVVADFAALDYISSAGLRAVIQAARAAQGRDVEFTICSLNTNVKRVFEMSGLHELLHVQGELPC